MNIILFDGEEWSNLRPLTLTKPLSELRMGILTFKERWEKLLEGNFSYLTQDYLSQKYPIHIEQINLFINPAYFPHQDLVRVELETLEEGSSIWYDDQLFAAKSNFEDFQNRKFTKKLNYASHDFHIKNLWDLFKFNDYALNYDFELLTKGRKSQEISSTNGITNPNSVFLEEGSTVEYAILNAKSGPIYVGKNAEIMEGSMVRGSMALCEGAILNMGSKIYGGTTIGPFCKVGGEVNNSILMAYSNKGHDGFLGNSILGEWCNLGADTNTSNLKNNYSEIKIWDYSSKNLVNSGLQFCGLMMGDFSKSAINTQFNTGTVVGISANVFEVGFPPKFIPSFSWGGGKDSERFELAKTYEAASKMMQRRKKLLTEEDQRILKNIYLEMSEY